MRGFSIRLGITTTQRAEPFFVYKRLTAKLPVHKLPKLRWLYLGHRGKVLSKRVPSAHLDEGTRIPYDANKFAETYMIVLSTQ